MAGPTEFTLDASSERVRSDRLAMSDEGHFRSACETSEPNQYLVGIGMCGQHRQVQDLRPDLYMLAVDLHGFRAGEHVGSPRACGLESAEENRASPIRRVPLQVMQ